MHELIAPVVAHLDHEDPGGVIGVYLFGSAAAQGLRPDSDIDLLVLTRRSLTAAERASLAGLLLRTSGWHGHAERFPDAAHGRPIELTSIVADDVQPWGRPPRHDFQYGEWLRADIAGGLLPQPEDDPDVVMLLATAHTVHRVLRGPALDEIIAPVPPGLLRRAVLAVVPGILEGVEGDERNTLLALARILVTVRSGRIVSKDEAADEILPELAGSDHELLERARDGYLGKVEDDWTGLTNHVASLAHALADLAMARAASTTGPRP